MWKIVGVVGFALMIFADRIISNVDTETYKFAENLGGIGLMLFVVAIAVISIKAISKSNKTDM